ncbi:sugar phosphate isomerase/epimerase family protein [Paramicrobacterium chengjingii]|uniref:sugar phosphate isomerase/epimerase family protein n=1 Tax=Paramicrobacterium chengjingii TaxID=2769067 RepID=UPI001F23FAE8|nr:sugar phosphate isomerase/epimerase [Microbacterium chengjingii]
MAKIGVQAMMLKDSFAEVGPYETLRKITAIGYHAVEISQIPMTTENVDELVRARDELGMDVASLSTGLRGKPGMPLDTLAEGYDKLVSDCHRLDTSMVRIGMLPFDAMGSLEKILEFCDETNAYAKRLADDGIRLYYHNHHIEFAKYDGKLLLDVIADRAPDVGLELDAHWIQRGGKDPATTIRKYSDRVAMIHLKDYRIGHMPDEVFESLMNGDMSAFRTAFSDIVQFAEVGEGNLDFTGIIQAALDSDAEYLLVEQDQLYGRDVFDCLQTSYDNLVTLGYSELF